MASKRRPLRLSSDHSVYAPRGFDRIESLRRLRRPYLLIILAGAAGLILLAYLLSGQPLILILAALVSGGGLDGLIRTHPVLSHRGLRDTVLYLVLPVLFTLGAGVFFRYILGGWSQQLPAATFSAVLLAGVMYAEYDSVDSGSDRFSMMRLGLVLAGYLAAFSLYTALYNRQLPLPLTAILVGSVSFLIGVEILREVDLTTERLLIYGAALGFVLAQARWALNFISLSGWLGGVFILIVFHVAAQGLQAYLLERLDRRWVLEFGGVAAIGTLCVIVGRVLAHA